ncbi:ATP-binding protein [Georgenia subflava]|uniref:ATP-grasp domain-containing protein n=1 Tax=Georgenia subflava TaxID=1622177 RepID=A0A6N7EGS1_9MICO|nr:hypothetical protein [Georgenia subflava]MPV35887.1 hypothetical protein [Georgenia subflava]
MAKHVFVLGLTDLQREELETVRGAENYSFHGLLDYDTLVADTDFDLEDLLDRARAELDAFDGSVDAIVCHWDFPSSVLGPVLSAERGLPAPSLTSILKSEHKYWSRLEQRASVPEVVPKFACFDPFAEDPLSQVDLDFPFWVKPVKAHSSNLGFEIHDAAEFADALEQIRAEITDIGDPFDQALARVDLPQEIRDAGGNSCLAEQVVTGIQAAPEGTVFNGEYRVHGLFDMHKDEAGHSITRLDYPADSVPEEVQQRMIDVAGRYLEHIGYDNGCFNAEYMWEPETDKLWLIEVNTRISQSHSDLFAKVDGASNHEVAIDIALGQPPRMPYREGRYGVASKCAIFHDEDGIVTSVPSDADKAAVRELLPHAVVTLVVHPGDRLSELPHQDSYRYILGNIYLGGADRDDLVTRYEQALTLLPFEFEPVDQAVGVGAAQEGT